MNLFSDLMKLPSLVMYVKSVVSFATRLGGILEYVALSFTNRIIAKTGKTYYGILLGHGLGRVIIREQLWEVRHLKKIRSSYLDIKI